MPLSVDMPDDVRAGRGLDRITSGGDSLVVKTWLADPPDWLQVRSSTVSLPYDPALDALDA